MLNFLFPQEGPLGIGVWKSRVDEAGDPFFGRTVRADLTLPVAGITDELAVIPGFHGVDLHGFRSRLWLSVSLLLAEKLSLSMPVSVPMWGLMEHLVVELCEGSHLSAGQLEGIVIRGRGVVRDPISDRFS